MHKIIFFEALNAVLCQGSQLQALIKQLAGAAAVRSCFAFAILRFFLNTREMY